MALKAELAAEAKELDAQLEEVKQAQNKQAAELAAHREEEKKAIQKERQRLLKIKAVPTNSTAKGNEEVTILQESLQKLKDEMRMKDKGYNAQLANLR